MKPIELIKLLNEGALEKYSSLYADINATKERFITAINEFVAT